MKRVLFACLPLFLVGCDALSGGCSKYVGTWSAPAGFGGRQIGTQNVTIVSDGSAYRVELSGRLYNTTLPATCQQGTLRTGSWLGDIVFSQDGNAIMTANGTFAKVK